MEQVTNTGGESKKSQCEGDLYTVERVCLEVAQDDVDDERE